MMHELTLRAESLLDLMNHMQAIDNRIAELCPKEDGYEDPCDKCPMRRMCIDDGHLDSSFEYNVEIMADYLDFRDNVYKRRDDFDYEQEQRRELAEHEAIERWKNHSAGMTAKVRLK